jgi:hypothetical protein
MLVTAQLSAQTQPPDSQVDTVVQRLFTAMRARDTTTIRAAFASNARIVHIPATAIDAASMGQGMSVNQFVAFSATNPPDSWIERMWNPSHRVSGPLADLWFDYDVYRSAVLDHCGVNSVQLQAANGGWKIVSMAFTAVTQGCVKRAPPP